tara:strand:+ start:574 stop:855 length:282 start_codon:yes stop_codon:yes gene_type:complete
MDKFVRTGSISYFGPESMDTEKILRDKILNKTYDSELAKFKRKMSIRINRFDPIKIINTDKTDDILKLLWFTFLFSNVSNEKQKELYLSIGLN